MRLIGLTTALLLAFAQMAYGQGVPTRVEGVGTSATPAGGALSVNCVSGCSGGGGGGNVTITAPLGDAAPSAGVSITPTHATPTSSSALAANLVVSASAAPLHSFNVSADSTLSGAAWWVMIYNAASAPADGSVTPVKCYALPSGATGISGAFVTPASFSTGIVIGVSTTGCFTKTASTHAFISGE